MKSLQFFNGSDQIGSANVFWLDDGTYLANFQIKPEYQRQGYGKQFMELLIALYHVDTLIVAQNNYPAYFLYKKCGFEIVSGYYALDLNTDVYCMKRKELNENV